MRRLLYILPLMMLISSGIVLIAQSPAEELRRREAVRDVAVRAEKGDAEALYQLSTLHERGYDSIPRDSLRAISLLRQSAEAGYPPAANMLGYKLMRGDGVKTDVTEGLKWIECAAEAGDGKALSNIGYLYLHGEGVERDEEKAAYWLERAADAGIASAQSMLGDMYRDGSGVAQDSVKAESLYRLAFDNGLTDAAYKLYDLTKSTVDSLPAPARLREGLYYFDRSAPSVGVGIFHEIAEGDLSGNAGLTPELKARAKALLGDAYSRGRGVAYDYERSTRYYLEAAKEGNHPAEFIIGEMLEIFPDGLNEILSPSDPEEYASAYYWLEQAAAADIRDASTAIRRLHSVDLSSTSVLP